MAKHVLKDATILIGGVDLSPDVNQIELPLERAEEEVTNFAGGGWREFLSGLKSGTKSFEGFLEDQADPEAELFTERVNVPVSMSKTNPVAEGDSGYAAVSNLSRFTRRSQIGAAFGFGAAYRPVGPVLRGVFLAVEASINANGNSSPFQLGAVAAGSELWALVHATSIGGTAPSVTPTIESDDAVGFISPVTRMTFNAITDAGGITHSYQWQKLAGPITDDWFRAAWTVTGTPDVKLRIFLARTG